MAVWDSSSVYVGELNCTDGAPPGVEVAVAVAVALDVLVEVGVGEVQAPDPVSRRFAADTVPVSPAALSVNRIVHVPFGFATPANAAVRFVGGEKFAAACGPACVVR